MALRNLTWLRLAFGIYVKWASEPKVSQREPKWSQRVTKMHLKTNLRKSCEREPTIGFAVRIFKKTRFYIGFPKKIQKYMKNDGRNLQKWENRPPGSLKTSPREPKWSQKWAKGCHKVAQREPKGVKREPKVSQWATKMHQKIDFRKSSRKGGACMGNSGFPFS